MLFIPFHTFHIVHIIHIVSVVHILHIIHIRNIVHMVDIKLTWCEWYGCEKTLHSPGANYPISEESTAEQHSNHRMTQSALKKIFRKQWVTFPKMWIHGPFWRTSWGNSKHRVLLNEPMGSSDYDKSKDHHVSPKCYTTKDDPFRTPWGLVYM